MKNLSKIEKSNKEFLERYDIYCDKMDDGRWELESYTDGGGDQLICVDNLTREELVEYLENYDVSEEANLWFNGRPGNGVPFDNYKNLWYDIEKWRLWMLRIAKRMPDGEEVDEKESTAQDLLEDADLDKLQNVFFSYATPAPSYIYDFIELIDEDKLHDLYVDKLKEMLTPDEIIETIRRMEKGTLLLLTPTSQKTESITAKNL